MQLVRADAWPSQTWEHLSYLNRLSKVIYLQNTLRIVGTFLPIFETGGYRKRNWIIIGVTDAIVCFLRCVVLKKTVLIRSEEDLFAACVLGDSFGTF